MAFPITATIPMVIRTIDSITTVTFGRASSCACKIARKSTLVSSGSMLFMFPDDKDSTHFGINPQQTVRPETFKQVKQFGHENNLDGRVEIISNNQKSTVHCP